MCWNAPVSLITFLTSVGMSIYLIKRGKGNDVPIAIFIIWFALMQLLECFMWLNMKSHQLVGKLALLAILLQPTVLLGSLYYFRPALYQQLWQKVTMLFIGGYSLLKACVAFLAAFIDPTISNQDWLSKKGPNCHLIWWFISHRKHLPTLADANYDYVLSLLVALLFIKPFFNQGLVYFLLGFMGVLVTTVFFGNENGSLWCFLANLMGIFAIAF